ncbi:MAG: hypothetical protein J6P03_05135 [Opitutales bacterium]|nr:hypothetical protein [Opitutales bacterium]
MARSRPLSVLAASIAVLFLAGAALSPLKKIASPAEDYPELETSAGENFLFGILGGYRPFAAEIFWLRAFSAWERRDVVPCVANIDFAAKLDPKSRMFWHMGADIIAFDTPAWIIRRDRVSSKSLQALIRRRQGAAALDFLDRGLKALPKSRQLLLDKALVYDKSFGDKLAALACLEKADDDFAPMHIVRRHCSALEELGRYEESLAALKKALPRFNPEHPATKIYKEHIILIENKIKSIKDKEAAK